MKYITNPLEVEGIHFNGHNIPEIEKFVGFKLKYSVFSDSAYQVGKGASAFEIITPLEDGSVLSVLPHHYIIKDKYGRISSCDPKTFQLTYTEKGTQESWKTRLVKEYTELKEKCDKLKAFINTEAFTTTLNDENQKLLAEQWEIMKKYLNVLVRRLCINNIEH